MPEYLVISNRSEMRIEWCVRAHTSNRISSGIWSMSRRPPTRLRPCVVSSSLTIDELSQFLVRLKPGRSEYPIKNGNCTLNEPGMQYVEESEAGYYVSRKRRKRRRIHVSVSI